ncbi:unnamed protein product [Gadus morhua 'NCC']
MLFVDAVQERDSTCQEALHLPRGRRRSRGLTEQKVTERRGLTEQRAGAVGVWEARAAHVRTVFTVRKDSINKMLRIREKRTTRCQKRGPGRERIWLEDGYIAIMKPRPRCSSSRRDDRPSSGERPGALFRSQGSAAVRQVRVLSGRAGRTSPPRSFLGGEPC